QEGDPRFRQVRNNSLRPITDHLATTVTESQAEGRVSAEISPMAAAAALVALLERMAAFHGDLESLGITRADVVETTPRIGHPTVTGAPACGSRSRSTSCSSAPATRPGPSWRARCSRTARLISGS